MALFKSVLLRDNILFTSFAIEDVHTNSTDDGAFQAQQLTELDQLARDMADADRAVMRWTFGVPGFHEFSRPHRETVAAVGVTNFENRAGLGNALGNK